MLGRPAHEEPFTSSSTRQWGFRNPAPVHPLTSTYVYKPHVQFSVLFGFRTWHVRACTCTIMVLVVRVLET